MKIGIDVFGGDYAPSIPLEGIKLLIKEWPSDLRLFLFGEKKIIESELKDVPTNKIEIVNATEVITMEDIPHVSFSQKNNSSLVLGFKYLKEGHIDGFCSAGNTGAMLIGATQVIGLIEGIIRPCIASFIPRLNTNPGLIADVGLNPDAKPEILLQYAHLTSKYLKYNFNIENPRIALLNIGTEPEKGNIVVKATYELMKNDPKINFIGNIEGYDLFSDKYDIVICDGFIGNILLKFGESFYRLLKQRKINDEFFEMMNFEKYGGAPILGIQKTIVVGHGSSTPVAIKNMILLTYKISKSNLIYYLKNN